MPRMSPQRSTAYRSTEGARTFADDTGRFWTAATTGDAIVFICVSDGRQSGRAIAVDLVSLDDSVGDETLRAWLKAAPLIGTLS